MRCSKMIIIFGMIFCFSVTCVRFESYVLRTILRQRERLDRAAEAAADAATENFIKGIYEPDPLQTAAEVFELVYAAVLDDNEKKLKSISASLNGKEIHDSEGFTRACKGDEIVICFEPFPETLKAPGREGEYGMIIVRTVTLD